MGVVLALAYPYIVVWRGASPVDVFSVSDHQSGGCLVAVTDCFPQLSVSALLWRFPPPSFSQRYHRYILLALSKALLVCTVWDCIEQHSWKWPWISAFFRRSSLSLINGAWSALPNLWCGLWRSKAGIIMARFAHIPIDLVGPLPPCQGFTYLLTCVDCFMHAGLKLSHWRTSWQHPWDMPPYWLDCLLHCANVHHCRPWQPIWVWPVSVTHVPPRLNMDKYNGLPPCSQWTCRTFSPPVYGQPHVCHHLHTVDRGPPLGSPRHTYLHQRGPGMLCSWASVWHHPVNPRTVFRLSWGDSRSPVICLKSMYHLAADTGQTTRTQHQPKMSHQCWVAPVHSRLCLRRYCLPASPTSLQWPL